ncbi:store-operated calcium entry-associated regulatory factor [Xiphophorus maculatus]|uniref:Store-operated calcium entry-associated regulatory factor n=1 Tax=Xiphophorus maculatus TaxID=8083 RepID=M4ANE0_XIPMA|nr:store-operated calcium entry-associated regulatory factor [Xiphophorus maculatus]
MELLPVTVVLLFVLVETTYSWNQDSVLLRDIQALTFYRNRFTTARRSNPVPQLKCVGGSAGCHVFIPDVVQCVNRGWDGVDVQWECKTDMDNAYRFGAIEVSCEGYSHPSDDYILKGSCGLEFTLELTQEGQRRTQGSFGSQGGFKQWGGLGGLASSFFSSFFGNRHHQHQQHQQQHQQQHYAQDGESSGGLLVVAVLLLIAYGLYKLFLSGDTVQWGQTGGQPGYPHNNHSNNMGGPPPPGFKPDYTGFPGTNPGYGFHNDYTQGQYYQGRRSGPGTGGGGGFWTGMGTGGMLGYLFGRQRTQPCSPPPPGQNHSSGTNTSSGTRTASGFGGTKRR